MQSKAHTQLNLVAGNPIRHSESPRLHQRIYDALGINAVMLAVENPPLPELIRSIRTLSIPLTAITLPFKTDILSYVDSQSDAVSTLHAANTLLLRQGKIHAENTDVDGILHALSRTDLHHQHVLIIGAGGAARAVGYALKSFHASLYWLNRTPEHAETLAAQWGGNVVTPEQLHALPLDIIINTTPIGMSPHVQATPLPDYLFKPHQTVFDLIYTPRETQLLAQARSAGAACISGINMFIAQAWQQVVLFQGKSLDPNVLSTVIHTESTS